MYFLDLKFYEPKMKEYFASEEHHKNIVIILNEYIKVWKTEEDRKIFTNEKSFPHQSRSDDDSQVDLKIIEMMQKKIEEYKLTNLNIEWYFLANGCYFVNRYITHPLMKFLFPNINWYFCETNFHCFVSNKNDLKYFAKFPPVMPVSKEIENNKLIVADLINYQINENLNYCIGMFGVKFHS